MNGETTSQAKTARFRERGRGLRLEGAGVLLILRGFPGRSYFRRRVLPACVLSLPKGGTNELNSDIIHFTLY